MNFLVKYHPCGRSATTSSSFCDRTKKEKREAKHNKTAKLGSFWWNIYLFVSRLLRFWINTYICKQTEPVNFIHFSRSSKLGRCWGFRLHARICAHTVHTIVKRSRLEIGILRRYRMRWAELGWAWPTKQCVIKWIIVIFNLILLKLIGHSPIHKFRIHQKSSNIYLYIFRFAPGWQQLPNGER